MRGILNSQVKDDTIVGMQVGKGALNPFENLDLKIGLLRYHRVWNISNYI